MAISGDQPLLCGPGIPRYGQKAVRIVDNLAAPQRGGMMWSAGQFRSVA
jgi:hypothetical protein